MKKPSDTQRSFVVQLHQARRLHYDFRLEVGGVLKSWALPKGPSLDPTVKRLAVPVEDHELAYADFEGTIADGEYGAGTVMVWDRGNWVPEGAEGVTEALRRGELKFRLRGKKLKGSWVLIRASRLGWLLIKHRDRFASATDVTVTKPLSTLSGRSLAEIAAADQGRPDPRGPVGHRRGRR